MFIVIPIAKDLELDRATTEIEIIKKKTKKSKRQYLPKTLKTKHRDHRHSPRNTKNNNTHLSAISAIYQNKAGKTIERE